MSTKKPSILYIVPSALDALRRKGVVNTILERDLDGFFGRVLTVHPRTRNTRAVKLGENNLIWEFGPDALPGSTRLKLLRLIQAPHYIWCTLTRTVKLVRSENVDLIQATDPYWMGLLGWVVSRLTGRTLCVSIHADYDQRYVLDGAKGAPVILGSRSLAKRLERFVLNRADTVLPIRDSLGSKVTELGVSTSIRIHPHGIDFEPFVSQPKIDIRKRFEIPAEKHILSFVGRLSNENYVDDLLVVARELANRRKDFVMLLVGGGNEEARLARRVAEDDTLSESVTLVGFQTREMVAEIRKASILSLCPMGGFSLIEACAAGSAPIAYDIEWHDELVHNGETGFLIKENDTDAVVEAATALLDAPDRASRLGKAARDLALTKHAWRDVRDLKRLTYTEIISKRRKGMDLVRL